MTFDGQDIRLAGQVDSDGRTLVSELKTEAQAQHLGCFAGGMVAMAAKIFQNDEDLSLATKLVKGCLWAYEVMPLGIMPEILHTVPCDSTVHCPWDEKKWHDRVNDSYEGPENVDTKIKQNRLPPGVAKVDDRRYILRSVARTDNAKLMTEITNAL
jgi:mannosyl-oligosaccharide alpha-1,2-mannosidase